MSPNARMVIIKGTKYPSIVQAAAAMGWSKKTLTNICNIGIREYRGVSFQVSDPVVFEKKKKPVEVEIQDESESRTFCPRIDHLINNSGSMHVRPENGKRLMAVKVWR